MFQRIALATLLISSLIASASAQKDTPTSGLTWETVGQEDASRLTRRAKIDGGWLYMVQSTNGVALTFVPDMGVVSKNKKDRKPKKADKGAAATDLEAVKKEAQAQRDLAEKARLEAVEARQQEAAARREAEDQRAKAQQLAIRAAEEAARAKAEVKKLQAELDLAKKEAERLKALLDTKDKK
jgi:hypothetical protein